MQESFYNRLSVPSLINCPRRWVLVAAVLLIWSCWLDRLQLGVGSFLGVDVGVELGWYFCRPCSMSLATERGGEDSSCRVSFWVKFVIDLGRSVCRLGGWQGVGYESRVLTGSVTCVVAAEQIYHSLVGVVCRFGWWSAG